MQIPKPTFNRFRRIALLLASLTGLLALAFSGMSCSRNQVSPIVFGHSALPTSTNAALVYVTATNLTESTVVYLACPAQVRSNGVWSGPPLPPRQRMTKLTAGQSGVLVFEAAALKDDVRVPILWGYLDYTVGASRWRQVKEGFTARLGGRKGVGLLYTNYLTDLKP